MSVTALKKVTLIGLGDERDRVLSASDIVNPDRLGNSVDGPNLTRPFYVDFTQATKVGIIILRVSIYHKFFVRI